MPRAIRPGDFIGRPADSVDTSPATLDPTPRIYELISDGLHALSRIPL